MGGENIAKFIRTKESVKDIKVLDKAKAATHRVVGAAINTKKMVELAEMRETPSEFSSEVIKDTVEVSARDVGSQATKLISSSVKRGRQNVKEKGAAQAPESGEPKAAQAAERADVMTAAKRDGFTKATAHKIDIPIKENTRRVKTARHSPSLGIKTPAASYSRRQAQTAKTTSAAKRASRAAKAARESIKQAARSAKAAARALLKTVKGIIAATKTTLAALAAGGSVTVVALVAICAVALLLGSAFGIFFSNETVGMKMKDAVAELSTEYYDEVKRIEASVAHDRVEYFANDGVNSLRWQDILSVYAVKLAANNSSGMEVVTLSEEKKLLLRVLMWEMTNLDYSVRTETIEVEAEAPDDDDEEETETQYETITILIIEITHIPPEEMAAKYSFDRMQNEQLSLLKDPEYLPYWAELLGGFLSGNGEIIVTDADWIPTGPFAWPLPFNGSFNSSFGYRNDPRTGAIKFHGGIDLGAATGTPILAANGGTVIVANATDPYYGYGYYVMINHGDGFMTLYGHCSSVGVVTGQTVSKGEVIAQVGSTGYSTGPHLHFEIYQGGDRVDPLGFFRQ